MADEAPPPAETRPQGGGRQKKPKLIVVMRLRSKTDKERAAEEGVPGGNPFLKPRPGFVAAPASLNLPIREPDPWVDVEVLDG